LRFRLDSRKRVSLRLTQMRRILHVDTQRTRAKLILQLEEVFQIASDYARGRIVKVVGEDGKERPLTIVERQWWARIAAYTAEIINNLAKGFDERQIDFKLDKLEAMLNKKQAEFQTKATSSGGSGAAGARETKPAGATEQDSSVSAS
jgi:hypothetical protein